MALIKCPECERDISSYAIGCPNCGFVKKSDRDMTEQQIRLLKSIRWTIVGFAIWFIIQAWILPKIIASFQ